MSSLPTDLPTYYTFRLTVSPTELNLIRQKVMDGVPSYLIWPHTGKDGINPHFHILVPNPPHKLDDKLRKRAKETFKAKGNGLFSGKYMTNSLSEAIHYLKHEDGEYSFEGSEWETMIADAAPWVADAEFRATKGYPKGRERLGDPCFTFTNVIKQALKYRQTNNLKTDDLGEVLEHMTVHTDWIPSRDIMSRGLDPLHYKLFKFRCGNNFGKAPNWWTPKLTDEFGRPVYKAYE